ncbi:MAG: putative dual-specificity RNA methyltransferase RlmN [candidate division TA06 bacterium 32_111]|uniref:23S rRNA (Adenine(2503)-C(2))-methyltransferase RlmN n=2 Tax=Bacteria candidate phyla TaxID=1783234 RepID=A0A348MM81_UNCW3|nr:MAG: putative dual-specificity RNA methyltransferase RlmN [candidate division TA06 bacterium 32_111]KUK87507.1 MAG: putative dual-specificity RNA methyltransferase RlmN [candidate division TA06 bacterium 34_109]HAF08157.1 23S rRNA (adenine(2503)-C(2))-methyltransferase RlmN [candidate division WOR-3 bacterium]HCP16719.1 23S rRNA (adenine(2503)-C(2))-methyltransferase RlmN [candidate division WOR-3 bacterium]
MESIYRFTLKNFKEDVEKKGFKPFKADQIFKWIYCKKINDFTKMTDLSLNDRKIFKELYDTSLFTDYKELTSKIDKTKKYLFNLSETESIEAVFMKEDKRITVCLSSQTGCPLKCRFCATGKKNGRNLSTEEIVKEFTTMYYLNPERITNIVFMGMGEPLLNCSNVLESIKIFNEEKGIKIGARKITVSTAGIVEGIERIIEFPLQIKLALSLNSAIEEKREYLMPVTKTNTLSQLKKVLKRYQKIKKKRITFEYIIIPGFNDGKKDIEELLKFLSEFDCKLNLIPYNKTDDQFREPTEKNIRDFFKKVSVLKDAVSIRKSKGKDISGACGQLKGKFTS